LQKQRTGIRAGFLAVALAVAACGRVLAAEPPPSSVEVVGKPVFAQLLTPDLARAKQFYGGLFDWTFQDIQASPAALSKATVDDQAVALLIQQDMPASGRLHPGWLFFFSVQDVGAADGLAVQHGGKLLFGPRDTQDLGVESVLADPQGAVFGILARRGGDQGDYLGDPGEWIWSSLITTDPDAAAGFYQSVFNYDVFAMPDAAEAGHLLLASGNTARGSINPLPTNLTGARAHWIDYVRVEDATATANRAAALGGRILVAPHPDRRGGNVAVIADPMGAVLGLLEWPDDQPVGDAK
jgi:predicted enzyme related to lactoylglutathione lyase